MNKELICYDKVGSNKEKQRRIVMKRKCFIRYFSIILSFVCLVTQVLYVDAKEVTDRKADASVSEDYKISQYVNNEMLIKFSEKCQDRQITSIIVKANVAVQKKMKTYIVAKASNTRQLNTAINYLKKNSMVEWVQPNFEYEQSSKESEKTYTKGNITFSQKQWGVHNDGSMKMKDEYVSGSPLVQATKGIDVNVLPFWEKVSASKQGKKVVVAVVDTGVDIEHPAFKGRLWKNKKEIAGDGIDNDKNGYIDDYDGWNAYSLDSELEDEVGHGTHCAGIIGANGYKDVWGVVGNSNVKIMPVKVFSKSRNGNPDKCIATSFSILWGLEYASSNGAKICSVSLGMNEVDNALREYMISSKMLFVCAAGNEGKAIEVDKTFPAYFDFSNIISVANIRWDGKLHITSNYSVKRVAIAAPGAEIYSTLPDGEFGYMTGTSMATPYVAGVAALLYSYTDRINATVAKNQIVKTATKLDRLTKKVYGGLVNVYDAYEKDVSAPSIQYKTTVKKSNGYADIKLNVLDYGNAGVKYVRWQEGKQDADYFLKGSVGNRVSATGTIRIRKSGSYTIYTIDKSGNETVRKLEIRIPAPSSVRVNRSLVTLKKHDSYTINPVINPSGVYVKYTFSSSNKQVATVDSKGKITAKRTGKTTIVVQTHNGKKCSVRVVVK